LVLVNRVINCYPQSEPAGTDLEECFGGGKYLFFDPMEVFFL